MKRSKIIADRAFYKRIMTLALPIMLQNGITNFVSLLDNIMVGQVGTEQMTAVSVVNQLVFIFNLCIFGALAGIGLFTAQMHGKGDREGVKSTYALKLVCSVILGVLGIAVLLLFQEPLIRLFLHDNGEGIDLMTTLSSAKTYLAVMVIGLIPYALSQALSSTQREIGHSLLPMVCGLIAVGVNMIFNYVLIFGKFGAPAMGVKGAAVATVISRFVELGILFVVSFFHRAKYYFFRLSLSSFRMPKDRLKRIFARATPLFFNETLWSIGMSLLTSGYSMRGLSVVAAMNICSTLFNVFNVVLVALGTAVSILLGQKLGAGEVEEAKADVPKVAAFSVFLGLIVGGILFALSGVFPLIYKTEPAIRALATDFLMVSAALMPVIAYLHTVYYTVRSGGKTLVTFVFDSGFICLLSVPTAFLLSKFTALPIVAVYALVNGWDVVKCVVGTLILRTGTWARNMTEEGQPVDPSEEQASVTAEQAPAAREGGER